MKQEYKKIAEVAVLAGRIMLESQAESYRIEDTVERILKTSQCQTTEVFANTTGLFVTLDDPSIEPITIVRRIKHRGTHLRKIHHVNNISRQLTKGEISLEEARVRLEKVDVSEYTLFHFDLAVFFLVVSFAVLLGGSIWDIAVSGLAALSCWACPSPIIWILSLFPPSCPSSPALPSPMGFGTPSRATTSPAWPRLQKPWSSPLA